MTHPRRILALMIAAFALTLFFGLSYKLAMWGQGYDQIDYQQSIWNTTQGRFLAISHYRHTESLWGMDFIPAILLVVPLYAIAPSALTLNALQALLMGLGALPLYVAASDRFGSRRAGLAWAAVYLLYPSVWYVTMSAPWQPRTLAISALIGAFALLQRRRLGIAIGTRGYVGFLLLLLIALATRTDTSLVVFAFGLLALVWRASLRWWLPPLLLGTGWFALSTSLVVPSFYTPEYRALLAGGGLLADWKPFTVLDYSQAWPGPSPQLAYYLHLGRSAREIVQTIITHPIEVLQLVLTGPKLTYVLLMLLPLALLPLLAPDVLLLAMPPMVMNLLANRPYQITVREQYQALLIPGLLLAAMVGGWRLLRWVRARGQEVGSSQNRVGSSQNRVGSNQKTLRPRVGKLRGFAASPHTIAAALLIAVCLGCNLVYRNPVLSAVRYAEPPERVAAMRRLAALIPPDAPLGATSFLAPNMMPRQFIYYVPGDASFPPLERAQYLFLDTNAAAFATPRARTFLADLRTSPGWQIVAEEQGLVVFRRIASSRANHPQISKDRHRYPAVLAAHL